MICTKTRPAFMPPPGTRHERAYVAGSSATVRGPRILHVRCPDCRAAWKVEDTGHDDQIHTQH